MKRKIASLVVAAILFVGVSGAPSQVNAADSFVYGFEDLPLMEPLSQVAGSSVLFDTPQGRIVQATATGSIDRQSVLTFYRSTLPQLGWTMTGDAEFRREGEILRLEFDDQDTILEVRFLIEPHS